MSQSSDPQYYFICSQLNGFVLGVSKNNDIVNQPKRYPPNPAQQWYLQENGGFTAILNKLNGHMVTLPVPGERDNNITTFPNQHSANQQWRFKLDAPTFIASAKTGFVFVMCVNVNKILTPQLLRIALSLDGRTVINSFNLKR